MNEEMHLQLYKWEKEKWTRERPKQTRGEGKLWLKFGGVHECKEMTMKKERKKERKKKERKKASKQASKQEKNEKEQEGINRKEKKTRSEGTKKWRNEGINERIVE